MTNTIHYGANSQSLTLACHCEERALGSDEAIPANDLRQYGRDCFAALAMTKEVRVGSRSQKSGFMLVEAVFSLALLGIILVIVAVIETRAAAATRVLENEYVATVAAESQFERLQAGLDVLDAKEFQRQYPGLELDSRVGGGKVVITILKAGSDNRTLFELTAGAAKLGSIR